MTTLGDASYTARYAWHRTSNNHWCRETDEVERFYASFCRSPRDPEVAYFPVTCHATFVISDCRHQDLEKVDRDVENAIRNAWTALRQEHPALSSWIQLNPESKHWEKVYDSFYQSSDAASQEHWLSETFRVVVSDQGGEWLSGNLSMPMSKFPTLFLVKSSTAQDKPLRSAVYLRAPHDMIDGIGALNLLNRLFQLAKNSYYGIDIGQHSHGDEVSRLSMPLRVAAGIPERPNNQQETRFQDLLAQNASIQTERPLLGLGLSGSENLGSVERATISLLKITSTRLLMMCKQHRVTVTHIISAALVMALRDLDSSQPDGSTVRYSNQALFNLRHLCKPTFDPFAVANYHMIAPCAMAIDLASSSHHGLSQQTCAQELLSVAKEFCNYYTSVRSGLNDPSDDFMAFVPMTWDLFTPRTSSVPLPPSRNAAVAISSLGNISAVVEWNHEPFVITEAWVVGEPLGTGVSTFLQTWSGITSISMLFNTAFHKKEYIEAFQEKIIDHLIDWTELE